MRRTIRLDGPLDLVATLGPLLRGRFDPTMALDRTEAWRAARTPDGPGTIRLVAGSDGVRARAWGPGAAWLVEHAPGMVGADDDVSRFAPRHPLLRDAYRRNPGLRIGRTALVVDALVPSVLEQKVTGREARRSYERLVRRYGERAPGPLALFVPPAPETLAALPYWELHPLGIEQRRAETLRRICLLARRMEEAAAMPIEEAYRRLQAVPGVGPWTAAEVARNAFGDPDAVSVGDYHLKNVVAWALAGEPRATDERMLELLEVYRGQRGRAIRLIEIAGPRPPRYGPRMPLRDIARI